MPGDEPKAVIMERPARRNSGWCENCKRRDWRHRTAHLRLSYCTGCHSRLHPLSLRQIQPQRHASLAARQCRNALGRAELRHALLIHHEGLIWTHANELQTAQNDANAYGDLIYQCKLDHEASLQIACPDFYDAVCLRSHAVKLAA